MQKSAMKIADFFVSKCKLMLTPLAQFKVEQRYVR